MKMPEGFSFPLMSIYIREKTGNESLSVYAAEIQDTLTDEQVCLVHYAPTPPPFKRGRDKGSPNWKLLEKNKSKSALITRSALEDCIAQWHERTGICPHCMGTGEIWIGWSIDSGHRHKPCAECGQAKIKQQELLV